MAPDNLPALARGVAERLVLRVEGNHLIIGEERDWEIKPLSWLWSPEGAFWLLGQMHTDGWDFECYMPAGNHPPSARFYTMGSRRGAFSKAGEIPEAVLRAAAAALGVCE